MRGAGPGASGWQMFAVRHSGLRDSQLMCHADESSVPADKMRVGPCSLRGADQPEILRCDQFTLCCPALKQNVYVLARGVCRLFVQACRDRQERIAASWVRQRTDVALSADIDCRTPVNPPRQHSIADQTSFPASGQPCLMSQIPPDDRQLLHPATNLRFHKRK